MKATNCRIVCREVEESEWGEPLHSEVIQHLQGCISCQDFYDERLKLRQLLGGLGTVEAPADFDFRLRKRIAADRSRALRRLFFVGWPFALRTVAVATAVLLMAAGLLFRAWQQRPNNKMVSVQSPSAGTPQPAEQGSQEVFATPQSGKVPVPQTPHDARRERALAVAKRFEAASRRHSSAISKDFSSLSAPVIKRNDTPMAAGPTFSIGASYQSFNLSLDDGSGVPRTISLPTVSFGSQRVLSRDGSPVATSAKGVW